MKPWAPPPIPAPQPTQRGLDGGSHTCGRSFFSPFNPRRNIRTVLVISVFNRPDAIPTESLIHGSRDTIHGFTGVLSKQVSRPSLLRRGPGRAAPRGAAPDRPPAHPPLVLPHGGRRPHTPRHLTPFPLGPEVGGRSNGGGQLTCLGASLFLGTIYLLVFFYPPPPRSSKLKPGLGRRRLLRVPTSPFSEGRPSPLSPAFNDCHRSLVCCPRADRPLGKGRSMVANVSVDNIIAKLFKVAEGRRGIVSHRRDNLSLKPISHHTGRPHSRRY